MQTRLISHEKQVNNMVVIARLLAGGATAQSVSRALKVTPPYVAKVAKSLLKRGILTKSGKYPVLYSWARPDAEKDINLFPRRVREILTKSGGGAGLFTPHHFGVSYFIMRRPEAWKGYQKTSQLGPWQRHIWHEGDFTIEAYPNKVKIWCFAFRAASVPELIREGAQRIHQRASAFQLEQGVKLAYDKPLKPYEWITKDKDLSNYLKNALRLELNPAEIAEARFKIDRSHPGKVELDKTGATEAAKALENLITHAHEIQVAAQGYETINRALMQQANLINLNTAVLQRLAEIIEKGKGGP